MKKSLTLILALMMLISVLACCNTESGTPKQTTNGATTNDVGDETSGVIDDQDPVGFYDTIEKRKAVSDGLPNKTFDGETFRILTTDWHTGHYFVEAEDANNTVDSAKYNRNLTVAERFDCEIVVAKEVMHGKLQGTLEADLASGECNYDLVAGHVMTMGEITQNDYFMNWYDVPYVDFEKPWWSQSNINDLTYMGACFIAVGDFVISSIANTWCVYYNKDLGANWGIEDNLYEIVDEGKFTLDYLGELTKDIYEDIDKNSLYDEADLYGYVSGNGSALVTYTWSLNNPIFKKDGDTLEYVFNSEKVVDILEKLRHYFHDVEGITCGTTYNEVYGSQKFAASQAVFANGSLADSMSTFAKMENYAILPYPKWDEAQENYYTVVDGGHDALGVPNSVMAADRTEFVGIITEALNAESFKQVILPYYEQALKPRGTRDDESLKTIDLIVSSRVFDFGFVYDGWKGAAFVLGGLINDPYTEFSSKYAELETQITTRYEEVIAYFEQAASN